ncbi:MAG: S66 peptidase family protein [Steroidobacteraceae bacterium]
MIRRRDFLAALAAAGLARPGIAAMGSSLIRPPRVRPGDKIVLVSPATAAFETQPMEIMADAFRTLDLEVTLGGNFYQRYGYFAGTDAERAADINAAFADPSVKMIFARGGWGSARLLPLLDYETITANPKVLLGYSDATALITGVHAKTGLVTFHGPTPVSRFSAEYIRRVVMDGEALEMSNPVDIPDNKTVQTEDRIQVLRPGKARGRLLGGNLTVLTAIMGSEYLPNFDGAILFLEDVNEAVYRVDRMFTELKLAGILDRIAGFVFGRCTDCDPDSSYGSLTLEEVLKEHILPLGIPAFSGSMIGHIGEQFTLPIGVDAEIEAETGNIRLLQPAVA